MRRSRRPRLRVEACGLFRPRSRTTRSRSRSSNTRFVRGTPRTTPSPLWLSRPAPQRTGRARRHDTGRAVATLVDGSARRSRADRPTREGKREPSLAKISSRCLTRARLGRGNLRRYTSPAFSGCGLVGLLRCARISAPMSAIRATQREETHTHMRLHKTLAGMAIGAAALLMPAAAWADSCSYASRAPAPCGTNCAGPVIEGNWVWLPSIGVPQFAWGFAPPGSADSTAFGFPGAHGNYTNGQTSSLLGMSAICSGANTARQTTNGVQSGCQ